MKKMKKVASSLFGDPTLHTKDISELCEHCGFAKDDLDIDRSLPSYLDPLRDIPTTATTLVLTNKKRKEVLPLIIRLPKNITAVVLDPSCKCIRHIYPYFLCESEGLKTVDLSSLEKLQRIDFWFLRECKTLTSVTFPTKTPPPIAQVGKGFLAKCESLTNVDLSPLHRLTKIPNSFLLGCKSLKALDLSPLRNVRSIGNEFASNCEGLIALDLSPFENVTQIGDKFLCGNTLLKSVNLPQLRSIQRFGLGFLANCKNIDDLDFSTFSNITTITTSFLHNCKSLTDVDLTPFTNVTNIEDFFLAYCTNLRHVKLPSSSDLQVKQKQQRRHCSLHHNNAQQLSIGHEFLRGCESIEEIDFNVLPGTISSVGAGFLSDCKKLSTIDLNMLRHITKIDDDFLNSCSSLKTLDLSPLQAVQSVGGGFLSGCEMLEAVDLDIVRKVSTIGDNFLMNCMCLQHVNLEPLAGIRSVGVNFLGGCHTLETLDLDPLQHVVTIGSGFLWCCTRLEAVDLSSLKSITSVGDHFLDSCSSVRCVDLASFHKVVSIGTDFLAECSNLTSLDVGPLANIRVLEDGFLRDCASLRRIKNFEKLLQVEEAGESFLAGCELLEEINLAPLKRIGQVGSCFLRSCTALEQLDLTPLRGVVRIDDNFLENCQCIRDLDLTPLKSVREIGDAFLRNCVGLSVVCLTPLTSVTTLGDDFLSGCQCKALLEIGDAPTSQVIIDALEALQHQTVDEDNNDHTNSNRPVCEVYVEVRNSCTQGIGASEGQALNSVQFKACCPPPPSRTDELNTNSPHTAATNPSSISSESPQPSSSIVLQDGSLFIKAVSKAVYAAAADPTTDDPMAQLVAIKHVCLVQDPHDVSSLERVNKRLQIECPKLYRLDHPHLLPVYSIVASTTHPGSVHVTTELLDSSLQEPPPLLLGNRTMVMSVIVQSLKALKYLHKEQPGGKGSRILHRNLTPSNFLYKLDHDQHQEHESAANVATSRSCGITVKLSDFWFTKLLQQRHPLYTDPSLLLATNPESSDLCDDPHTKPADIYSWASCIGHITTQIPPWNGVPPTPGRNGSSQEPPYTAETLQRAGSLSPEVAQLLVGCLSSNPNERPKVKALLDSFERLHQDEPM